jgi:hypothetical protein
MISTFRSNISTRFQLSELNMIYNFISYSSISFPLSEWSGEFRFVKGWWRCRCRIPSPQVRPELFGGSTSGPDTRRCVVHPRRSDDIRKTKLLRRRCCFPPNPQSSQVQSVKMRNVCFSWYLKNLRFLLLID